jgi:hypothetical protein
MIANVKAAQEYVTGAIGLGGKTLFLGERYETML